MNSSFLATPVREESVSFLHHAANLTGMWLEEVGAGKSRARLAMFRLVTGDDMFPTVPPPRSASECYILQYPS